MRSVILLFVAAATPALAQAPKQFTAQDYARSERFLNANATPLVSGIGVRPTFLDDGRFWYRVTTTAGADFVMIDPVKRTRMAVFDQTRLGAALSAATGSRVTGTALPFQTFDISKDNRTLVVAMPAGQQRAPRRWKCDLQTYACTPMDTTPAVSAPPRNASVSPDGSKAAFIRDYNLWMKDLATGRETQLTTDGIKDFGYATDNAGWAHSERPVLTWSPDSKQIATFQHDGRGVRDMVMASTNVGVPRAEIWKYPLPGDSVIFRISRVVIHLLPDGGAHVLRLKMPPDQHRSTVSDHVNCGGEVCDLQWYPDGSHVAFISSSRDHKHAWMRVANASTGDVRTLFEETSKTQIGDASLTENLWRVLPASNELIWWSQKDNWVHLYLHDLTTGALKNRITVGDGNVESIVKVDEKARVLYFMAGGSEVGRDPYFQHFYRISFDGKNRQLLTPEIANHSVAMSPDAKYFVDTYSTPATPPITVLRDPAAGGRQLLQLEKADISRLVAAGWRPPTAFTVKARDGKTDIYGLMFTPSNLDSAKKYPMINYIYPGPQSGSVGSRSFAPARSDHQALAELGFVVVAIDGLGTPGRSKDFMDYYYGRMGDNTIPDQVAGMKEVAKRYPFADTTRVGIWGHSGGGFATASAMFKFTDFFDVGIAESGNHDNRNYEDDWGERYQGLLVKEGQTDNYTAEANQTHAKNLKSNQKFMLAHGAMDDNVPIYNTYLVADALVKANRDFDLLVFPNARHGYGADGPYMMRRRWDYFVKNLLGAEPPKDYQIGRPQVVP